MPWLKVDDAFTDHPKVIGLSLEARGLWLTGLVYAGRRLTDGLVPTGIVTREIDGMKHAEVLVAAGLWERVENGFQVHDYDQYQPMAKDVLLERCHLSAIRSEAGKKGAFVRWNGKGDGKPIANGWQRDSPVSRTRIPKEKRDKSLYAREFENWYARYPKKVGRQPALAEFEKLTLEEIELAKEGLTKLLPDYESREQQHVPNPATWLHQKRWTDSPHPPRPSTPALSKRPTSGMPVFKDNQ